MVVGQFEPTPKYTAHRQLIYRAQLDLLRDVLVGGCVKCTLEHDEANGGRPTRKYKVELHSATINARLWGCKKVEDLTDKTSGEYEYFRSVEKATEEIVQRGCMFLYSDWAKIMASRARNEKPANEVVE